MWRVLPTPKAYRGTTVQVCGIWPFAAGSARPAIGVPIGPDIETGATVCCDHFAWFQAGLISSASISIYGLPGMGKSSFAIRIMLGLADRGIVNVVAGDLKGEYTPVVKALGGQVLSFGSGEHLNVLDQGAMLEAARRIGGEYGEVLQARAIDRALDMVVTLLQIIRRATLDDWEQALLRRGIQILVDAAQAEGTEPPTLPDLARLLQDPPQQLVHTVLAENREEYLRETKVLNRSLQALLDGPQGRTFSGQTTERIRLESPAVSVDLQVMHKKPDDELAAVMLATWSEVFSTIEASNALTDAGLAPQRWVNTIMDEMWRAMRLPGANLVDKADAMTRLNRSDGMGNMFITHSLKDHRSLGSEADNVKATGFAERSGIVATAGLALPDLRELSQVKRLSEKEIFTASSWATPPGWQARMVVDPRTGLSRPAAPPGAGKILIKVGDRAGVPTQCQLTQVEKDLHDTNQRWLTDTGAPSRVLDGVTVHDRSA